MLLAIHCAHILSGKLHQKWRNHRNLGRGTSTVWGLMPFQAGHRTRQPNLALVFYVYFMLCRLLRFSLLVRVFVEFLFLQRATMLSQTSLKWPAHIKKRKGVEREWKDSEKESKHVTRVSQRDRATPHNPRKCATSDTCQRSGKRVKGS